MDVPAAVPTAPVAARRSGPRRVAIVAVVLLIVTIIRPWGAAGAPAPAAAAPVPGASDGRAITAVAPTARADPSPGPSLLPDEIACNPSGWTVVSLDRLGPWTARSWVPAHPVRADGPLDPRIGRLTLESPEVLAIGVCTPAAVDSAGATVAGGPAHFATAWRIDGGRATAVALDTRRPHEPPTVAPLYRPAGAVAGAGTPAHWPGGEYVVELQLDDPVDGAAGGWFLGLIVRGPE